MNKIGDRHDIASEMRFSDWKNLAAASGGGGGEKVADAVVIAILDDEHALCVNAFAKLGYAILCEKVRRNFVWSSLSPLFLCDIAKLLLGY